MLSQEMLIFGGPPIELLGTNSYIDNYVPGAVL
jgi:hypothetical protein